MIDSHENKNTDKGFSLVETLVAITILLVAVASPLTIASRSLFTANVARDQIVAFYLTQDAIEYIRAIRDGNAIGGGDWLSGLESCTGSGTCRVDTTTPEGWVKDCPGAVCPPLNFDYTPETKSGSRLYGYNDNETVFGRTWPVSNFVRTIKIRQEGNVYEARIEVTVLWNTGYIWRSFTVYENIYDW